MVFTDDVSNLVGSPQFPAPQVKAFPEYLQTQAGDRNFILATMSSRIMVWVAVAISSGAIKGTHGDHVRGSDGQTGGVRGQSGGRHDDSRDPRLPASALRGNATIELSSTASMQHGVHVTTSQTHITKTASEDSSTIAPTTVFARSFTSTALFFSSEESTTYQPNSFERLPNNTAHDFGRNQSVDAGITEGGVHESTAIWVLPFAFIGLVLIMTVVAAYRRRVTVRAMEAMLAKKANDTNWIISSEAQVVKIHGRLTSGDLESGLVALSVSELKPQTSQFINPAYNPCYATAKAVHVTDFTGNVHEYSELHRGSNCGSPAGLLSSQRLEQEYSRLQLANHEKKSDVDGVPVVVYQRLGSRAPLFDDYAQLMHANSSTSSRGSCATINDEDRGSREFHAYEKCCDSVPAVPLLTNLRENSQSIDSSEPSHKYDEPIFADIHPSVPR